MLKQFTSFAVFLCLAAFVSRPIECSAQAPQISWESDTIFACASSPYLLVPTVSGLSPFTFFWQDGSTNPSFDIPPYSPAQQYTLTVIGASGDTTTSSIFVVPLSECVLPGDGNGDRLANATDVLALGYAYGAVGPQRPNAHTQWIEQGAPAWGQQLASGVDFVHSDTDGDGLVNLGDFDAIAANYSAPLVGGLSPISSSGVPLSIRFDQSLYQAGDTVHAEVWIDSVLGTPVSLYGVAFSVSLEGFVLEEGSVTVDYSQSVLGSIGTDLVGRDSMFNTVQQLDVGISRIDQVAVQVQGKIADITVVIEDVVGKKSGIDILTFTLENLSMMDSQGDYVSVSPGNSEISISYTTTNVAGGLPQQMRVYPQPVQDQLTIQLPTDWQTTQIALYDPAGRIADTRTVQSSEAQLDLSRHLPGLYLLRVYSPLGMVQQKILIE